MKGYLETAAQKYGVFISDFRYMEALKEKALLDLTQQAEHYSLQEVNEAAGYLENRKLNLQSVEEVRRQIFRFLGIGMDNVVIGSSDCGDLVRDERDGVYLVLCEPGTHPIGTSLEDLGDAVYLGEDRNDI